MKVINLIRDQHEIKTDHTDDFALDVLMGLCSKPKNISAKYFYDDKGSELFQKITQHDDYYPTRTEFEILKTISHTLPNLIDEDEIDIIELGVGDGHKSKLLVDGFLDKGFKVHYFPVDISEKAMDLLEVNISNHKNLSICGIVSDYFEGLRYLRNVSSRKQIVLFLGSNIGNYNFAQSQGFLRTLWNTLDHKDYALIGFDLKKDIHALTAAYNDSSGYTRDFNLNLLERINNELGGDFNLSDFGHFGVYNPILGAMESYLLAKKEVVVNIEMLRRKFHFKAFEPIHLEYSFKFLKTEIDSLSEQTGFDVVKHFSDDKDYFVDSLWQVKKLL